MLKNSTKFFEAFDKADREEMEIRITINGKVYTKNDIFSFSYDSGSMPGTQLEIGSSYSNSIKITFCDTIRTFRELDKIVVELGIKRGAFTNSDKNNADVRVMFSKGRNIKLNRWNAQEEYEYSVMGEFYISEQIDVNWNEKTTSIECSDALIFAESAYKTNLSYPNTLKEMAREIAVNMGLVIDYANFIELPDLTLGKLKDGLTNREALEKLSHFIIGYVRINRYGYLELKSFVESDYSIDPSYYFQKGLTKNDIRYKVGGIYCTVEVASEPIELHSGSTVGPQIKIDNNLMTQILLDSMFEKLTNVYYFPFSLSWRGNPALEAGDYVTVSDLLGNIYKVPNITYSLEFNGSLKATSSANTSSLTDIVASDKSPLLKGITKSVNEVKKENVTINQKVVAVNKAVETLNKAIEEADLQGIKQSVEELLSITETFSEDIQDINQKVDGFDIPALITMLNQIKTNFDNLVIPVYENVSTQNNGLFTKENYQIFLNQLTYLNEIMNGTNWVNLSSSYTAELYAPRYRKRNKRVELQFSLKGFTAEGQTAVTLPLGSRSTIPLQKSAVTTSGKTALVSIGTDGTVKISKVFGFNTYTGGVVSTDIVMLDTEFPID